MKKRDFAETGTGVVIAVGIILLLTAIPGVLLGIVIFAVLLSVLGAAK